ncbi:hypothetical protein FOCC_FOCC017492 [Frankliniella occidentalis]|nr:hypothetical protein FOCC_FOCC017492 [Frankliniella occidentalis]
MIVCNTDNRECMLRLCTECKSIQQISEMFYEFVNTGMCAALSNLEDEEDFYAEQVEYKQWKSTDRTDLVTEVCSRSELINIAAKEIVKLIPHDFIAKEQALYLKNITENLPPRKAVAQMDFSMNYSCLYQDEVQNYHWCKKQVTVHPVYVLSLMIWTTM